MNSSKQIFEYFPGIWRLTRITTSKVKEFTANITGGECINANGYAAFIKTKSDPNVIVYSEKVTVFNLGAGAQGGIEAKQKYKYKYDPMTATVTKYFSDDRLFYQLNINDSEEQSTTAISDLSCFRATGDHLCIQDNYAANYSFSQNPNGIPLITLTYSVNGPKKCYDIITEYERIQCDNLDEFGIVIENEEIVWDAFE